MAFDPTNLGGTSPRSAAQSSPTPPASRPSAVSKQSSSGAAASTGGLAALRVSLMPTELAGSEGPNFGRRLFALILVLILVTLAIGGANFYLSGEISNKTVVREQKWARVEALTKVLQESKVASAEAIDFERQAKVVAETLDAHVYWTNFFTFLESVTKETVIYDKFSGDVENSLFTVDAVAKSYRDMAEQVVNIKDHPAIVSVKVSSASEKLGQNGAIEGIFFSLIVKAKPDVWKRPVAEATQ